MVFKHKLIYNAAPGIRIWLFLFLETLTPTAELAGASLRALVSLGAVLAGFVQAVSNCRAEEFTPSSAAALGTAPFLEGGNKECRLGAEL